MKNLFQQAEHCLQQTQLDQKMQASADLVAAWRDNQLDWQAPYPLSPTFEVGIPQKPALVPFQSLPKRGFNTLEQRAALIHALAHIEFTAVNLSWDSVYRFQGLPKAYYDDWIDTASDETRHFLALQTHLQGMGYHYGDFAAHNALWLHALKTTDDVKHRMAIIHRTLEARSLDVVPLAMARFEAIKEFDSARLLGDIANDEIKHVSAASRWFYYQCEKESLVPMDTFFDLVKEFLGAYPKAPFNLEARRQAGYTEQELAFLQANAPNRPH